MAMTDDPPGVVDESLASRSRSSSPQHRQLPPSDYTASLSYSSASQASQSPPNGSQDAFQLPRYNFPPNLVPANVRPQPSLKSPIPRSQNELGTSLPGTPMSRPSDSSSTAPSHVTETHHITKDYDSRTGAKTINRYEFHDTIGRGVHGKVKLARDIETGEQVAIKIVNRVTRKRLGRWNPMEAEQKIRREIAIMKKCKHPNVVALREVMDDPDSKKIYLGITY